MFLGVCMEQVSEPGTIGIKNKIIIYSVKSSRELVFIVIQKPNSNKAFLSYLTITVDSCKFGPNMPSAFKRVDLKIFFFSKK